MRSLKPSSTFAALGLALALLLSSAAVPASSAQSRRAPTQEPQKKNRRPDPAQQQKQDGGEEAPPPDAVAEEADPVKVSTALVNIEAVVIHNKTKQIVTGLKKENFAVRSEEHTSELQSRQYIVCRLL